MRFPALILTLVSAALLLAACGSSEQSKSAGGPDAMPTATVKTPGQSQAGGDQPPVSVAHGAPQPASGAPPPAGSSGAPDTAALDKKIEQAEAKAKAPKASDADKKAAASAYVERANVFYNAGQPMLYKFALRDFRLALRYDPSNEEALSKRDQIVQIYQQMGRPVPDLGNEP
jgi:tetratricopeptide (TPR) repeat protein